MEKEIDRFKFNNKVARLCRWRGYSIEALSKISNVNQKTIEDIECGNIKNPQFNIVKKLADALDVPVDLFYDGEKNESRY